MQIRTSTCVEQITKHHAGSIPASAAEGVNPETLKDKVDDGSERRANGRMAQWYTLLYK